MSHMTRRQIVNRLALTCVLSHVACSQEDCAEEVAQNPLLRLVICFLFGQDLSEILMSLNAVEVTPPIVTLPPPPRIITIGNITGVKGVLRVTVGGPPPPAQLRNSIATGNHTDAVARAFYLLDSLGDGQVDGRVYAIDANEGGATLRGSVTLRPAMAGAPSLQLRDMALSTDGRLLIVSQIGDPPQWIFIDTASLTIAGRLMAPSGVFPRRSVISPDGKLAYAVAYASASDPFPPPPAAIHILDTARRTITGTIPLPANTAISDLVITPDEGLLFGVGNRLLHVVDVATGTYSGNVDAVPPLSDLQAWSGSVERVVRDPRGEKLYAAVIRNPSNNFNLKSAAVAVFDVRSAQKIAEFPLRYASGVVGARIGISPFGDILLAGLQLGTEVQLFDTASGAEVASIPVERSFRFTDLAVA